MRFSWFGLVWLGSLTRSGHAFGGREDGALGVVVGKGREIGGTSEDRDSVVQFETCPL